MGFQGRFSYVGARPWLEIVAKENVVTVLNQADGTRTETVSDDPMTTPVDLSKDWKPVAVKGLPPAFCGKTLGLRRRT